MKRLLIANGTFSSLVLSSILNDKASNEDSNYFLGYFKNSSIQKSQELFNFFNIIIKTNKNLNFFDYKKNFGFNFSKFSKDIDTETIDEIYIPINSSTKKIYKLFQKQFPNASFILYEEGLMSYIKPLFDNNLRKIMAKSDNFYLFYDEKLKNLLLKSFPKISFKTIIKNNMLDNIQTIQNSLPPFVKPNNSKLGCTEHISNSVEVGTKKNEEKYALVLPQYYHQGNKKKTSKIISLYHKNIQKIIDKGYIIIFKDHPKAKLKYSDSLKNIFSKDDFILFEDLSTQNLAIFPVEVFAPIIKIDMVFSVYSTSLFTFKYLFDTTVFTSYKMLDERINFWSIYPTFSALITKNIINNLFIHVKNTNKLLHTENKLLKIFILMLKFIHKYKE